MSLLFVISSLFLFSLFLLFVYGRRRPFIIGRSILFVFAHPDDEAMFFVPTIRACIKSGMKVHLLCLSHGNYDGLGKTRAKELVDSGIQLGIAKENVNLVEHEELQDGPDKTWPADLISSIVSRYCLFRNIDSVVTFDARGVSGHVNHVSTYYGVLEAHRIRSENESDKPNFNLYTLDTVSFVQKYSGVLSVIPAVLSKSICITSLSPWDSFFAMRAHSSQFVWFRYLFVAFSSYTSVNTLTHHT